MQVHMHMLLFVNLLRGDNGGLPGIENTYSQIGWASVLERVL